MTGATPPVTVELRPEPGGNRIRRTFTALAAVSLIVVPPAGPWSLVGLGFAFAVLVASLWPPREATGLAEGATAAWAGGAVLAIGLFAAANPWFGVLETRWPWALPAQDRAWSVRVDALATIFLALFATVVGLSRPRRPATWVALLTLGLYLAARGYAENPAFQMIRIDRLTFVWMLGACALGAGLLHLASPRTDRRGLARGLLVAGVAAVLSVYLAYFPGSDPRGIGSLEVYADHYRRAFHALVLGEETDPELRNQILKSAWAVLVPFTLQGLCLVTSLVLALLPSRATNRGVRYAAGLAWLALFLTWVVPPKAGMWFFPGDPAAAPVRFVAGHVTDIALRSGLPTWLIVGGAIAALLGRPLAGFPAAWARGERRSASPRWGHAVGALLTLALIARCFRSGTGSVFPPGLAELFHPLAWIPPVAVLLFQVLLLLSALVAVVLPAGGGRGGLVAAMSVMAWGALTDRAARDYGLEAFVPLAVLSVAAGALWAGTALPGRGRSIARLTAGASGGVLLMLLLYPMPIAAAPGGGGHEFVNAAMEFVGGWGGDRGTSALMAATAPWRVAFAANLIVGLLATQFALRGRAAGGHVAMAVLLLNLAYAALWGGLVQYVDLPTALYRAGDALQAHGLPMAALLAAGVRDLHVVPGAPFAPPPSPALPPD